MGGLPTLDSLNNNNNNSTNNVSLTDIFEKIFNDGANSSTNLKATVDLTNALNEVNKSLSDFAKSSLQGTVNDIHSTKDEKVSAFINTIIGIKNKSKAYTNGQSLDSSSKAAEKIVKALQENTKSINKFSKKDVIGKDYLRNLRRFEKVNPFIKNIFPGLQKNFKNYASFADFISSITKKGSWLNNIAKSTGTTMVRSNASVAGFGKASLLAASYVLLQKIGELSIKAFKYYGSNTAQSIKMGARTGKNFDTRNVTDLTSRLKAYGYSTEAAFDKQDEFIREGVTDKEAIRTGALSEKLFGINNASQFTVQMQRRGNLDKYGNDLTKVFQKLSVVVNRTGLSMTELQGGINSFFNSIKGGGFDDTKIATILSKYSGLLKSGNISVQDISDMYGQHQRMAPNKLLTYTHFAQQGGFDLGGGDLISNAYRIRHMKSGNTDNAAKLRQASLKGLFQQTFGKTSWKDLTDNEKSIASMHLLPQAFDFDIPDKMGDKVDEFISLVESGTSFDRMPEDFKKALEEAQKTDADRIQVGINALKEPVDTIKNILLQRFWNTQDESILSKLIKDNKSKDEDNKREPSTVTVNLNYAEGLDLDTDVAGSPSTVVNKRERR